MRTRRPLTLRRHWRNRRVRGRLYAGDAIRLLDRLEADSADVVFLDPPFNLGKKYGRARNIDSRSTADYGLWLAAVVNAATRVLAPGGALFLYHLPEWAIRIGAQLDAHLTFRHWIAVAMKNGFVRGQRLYPAHYGLLYFTKGSPTAFSRPKLSAPRCRHCNEYVKDYGGYQSIIDKQGINLSDVWDDMSPVRHRGKKHRVANELPQRLTDRVVAIAGRRGGTLVDPFTGTGTAVLSAIRGGMTFVAGDLLRDNCNLTARRIDAWLKDQATERQI